MTPGAMWLRMAAVLMLVVLAASNAFAAPDKTLPCTSPEYRQFDFWIGDWDVYENDSATSSAHVRIDRFSSMAWKRSSVRSRPGPPSFQGLADTLLSSLVSFGVKTL